MAQKAHVIKIAIGDRKADENLSFYEEIIPLSTLNKTANRTLHLVETLHTKALNNHPHANQKNVENELNLLFDVSIDKLVETISKADCSKQKYVIKTASYDLLIEITHCVILDEKNLSELPKLLKKDLPIYIDSDGLMHLIRHSKVTKDSLDITFLN